MTSYANMFKWFVNKLPGKRIFIFDLDRTLWNFTVEYRPYMRGNDALWRRPREGPAILEFLQEKGHELNIASRSSEPDRCRELIHELYPKIKFANTHIYLTPLNKRNHINGILARRDVPEFFFFDDEIDIIKDVKQQHKNAVTFHTPNGISYGTFVEKIEELIE